ncbi:MAG: YlzJ-like family protein [Betaproteobacteria bacterium]
MTVSFLYTVVPGEQVWEDDSAGEVGSPLVCLTYLGVPLLARRAAEGAVIERLLTTDPNAYLNPGLSPGTLLPGVFPEA